jgi:D-glycero-D-manno-heptose 1,7-bisphosphate phosphatase
MRVVFLDRDGTIIADPPDERVDTVEKIQLFPQTIEALKLLASLDYGVIIITNQAGIAEGRITEADFQRINTKVLETLQPSGINVLKTYVCPHSPEDNCDCRKPKPTMLLEAAKDFDIDLANSWIIGDHESDIKAGLGAGAKAILVKTANKPEDSEDATYTATNLLEAIKYIADHDNN